jgi:PKD repeat protein
MTPAITAAPGFVNAAGGDFHLTATSSLIDAGTAGTGGADEPITDLDGNPRVLDGTGTCRARRDLGAYELSPSALPATATALTPTAALGVPIAFQATGCSADPSLTAVFNWAFDDGASASGSAVTHTFATPGTHTATVVISDGTSRSGTANATVTVQAPAAALPIAPALSALTVAPKSFRAAARGATITAVRRTGATISYNDSEAAVTTFTVTTRLPGIVRGGICVAMPKAGAGKAKRCRRTVTAGTFTHPDAAGRTTLHFSGRLRSKALVPGTYTLTAIAKNAAGQVSRPVTAKFKVVR